MALESEDRTEDLVRGHRSQFEAKPSNAQMPRKTRGMCRMVVEFPFDFSKEFLLEQSALLNVNLIDGVDYLREIKKRWENGSLNMTDVAELSARWSGNGARMEASK